MKKFLIILCLSFLCTHAYSNLTQENLQKSLLNIQTSQENEKKPKIFQFFVKERVLKNLNFNIQGITVVSQNEPDTRPGFAPDWGTEIFESMVFENIQFEDCNFQWINFTNAHFKNVKFIRCNFQYVAFDQASFNHVVFEESNLSDAIFYKADLKQVLFSKNLGLYTSFMQANLENVSFVENNLEGSNFHLATGHNTNFPSNTNPHKKPFILVSWNDQAPGVAGVKALKRIQELGGIPLKFHYKDPEIDSKKLQEEVKTIFKNIEKNSLISIPKQILDFAVKGSFPEIEKIKKKAHQFVSATSGVYFPGGRDIQPYFYGQETHSHTMTTEDIRRDVFEFAILDELDRSDRPFLGVCRGIQIANIWYGGTLNQFVEGHHFVLQEYHLAEAINENQTNSVVANIFHHTKEKFIGYSHHFQTIGQVGQKLTVTARSDDQTIKAMEMLNRTFFVLIQWHPEYQGDLSTPQAILLNEKISQTNIEIYKKFIEASLQKDEL